MKSNAQGGRLESMADMQYKLSDPGAWKIQIDFSWIILSYYHGTMAEDCPIAWVNMV